MQELRKRYGEVVALGGADLSVEPGTVILAVFAPLSARRYRRTVTR